MCATRRLGGGGHSGDILQSFGTDERYLATTPSRSECFAQSPSDARARAERLLLSCPAMHTMHTIPAANGRLGRRQTNVFMCLLIIAQGGVGRHAFKRCCEKVDYAVVDVKALFWARAGAFSGRMRRDGLAACVVL